MTLGNTRTDGTSSLRGFLLILVAVSFWGGSASLAKFLILHRFDTLIITQTRSSLSFVLMVLYFAVVDRSVFRIRSRDIYKFVLLGVIGIAVTNFTYYYTAAASTVATAILVQYTAPVWVTLYAVVISREEHFNGLKAISLLLALVGCYFAVTGGTGTAFHLPGWTALTGPASALTFAFLMIYTKRLSREYRVWTILIYMFGVAAAFWMFVNPPWQIAAHGYSASDWGVLWLFAVVSILIPHTAFTASLKLLEASTVGIIGTLEPVIAIVVAAIVLHETLTGIQMLGAAGVIAAVLLLQWGTNRYLKNNRKIGRANGTAIVEA